MAIPPGPYPAVIDFADVAIGMLIRGTGAWPGTDGNDTTLANTGIVAAKDANGLTLTVGIPIASPTAFSGSTITYELMEGFSGIPGEPAEGVVIKAPDGTVYQRTTTGDPTVSQWVTVNSTTPVTWSDITAGGEPMALGT